MPLFLRLRCLVFFTLLAASPILQAEWTTLKDCELVNGDYADGDSFHVHSGSREMIIRLYFVNTPETDDRYPERMKEQADYFGITVPESLKLGEKAAKFARKTLGGRFTVVTQKEDARGASREPRYYGFVLLDEGKTNYAELLVQNGLARVFGAAASRPDGPDTNEEWQRLRRIEAKAKSQKLGGWGGKTAPGNTPKGDATSSNTSFFERAKAIQKTTEATTQPTPAARPNPMQLKSVLAPIPASPVAKTPAPEPAIEGNLHLNTATVQELADLPKNQLCHGGAHCRQTPFCFCRRSLERRKDERNNLHDNHFTHSCKVNYQSALEKSHPTGANANPTPANRYPTVVNDNQTPANTNQVLANGHLTVANVHPSLANDHLAVTNAYSVVASAFLASANACVSFTRGCSASVCNLLICNTECFGLLSASPKHFYKVFSCIKKFRYIISHYA